MVGYAWARGGLALTPLATITPPALSPQQRRPTALDWGVLASMLVLGCINIFLTQDLDDPTFDSRLQPWADYLTFAVLVLPVAIRRMVPVAACLWVGVGFAVFRLLNVPEGIVSTLAVFLVIHAAGAYVADARRRDVARGLALLTGFFAMTVQLFSYSDAVSFDSVLGISFIVAINVGFYVAAWVLGDAARKQRLTEAELAHRAAQLADERDRTAEQAVTEERVRIARELHDVVAHHVSVMGVQAAAARHVLDRDRDRAVTALNDVEESARQAVSELHRLVGLLRSDGEPSDDAPQPTLQALPALMGSMRSAGLDVEMRVVGRARPLPSTVQLSAYRIVQEALTNVMRHAPGAEATVVINYLPDTLKVEIVNGPPEHGRQGDGPGGGRGLLGMRERAAILGGHMEHGSVSRGGYRVAVALPAASTYDAVPAGEPIAAR